MIAHLGLFIGTLLLFLLPMLAGCGGGGSGAPEVPPVIPPATPPVAQAPADPLTVLQGARRVLVFLAHADDETLIAPLLLDLCRNRNCRAVFVTEGGGPGSACLRGLCEKDSVEVVRARERDASAALLRYEPVQLSWPYLNLRPESEAHKLWLHHGAVDQVRASVVDFAPDAIITFDPAHGTTGHDEHKLLGRIVAEALVDRELVLIAHRLSDADGALGFEPAGQDVHTYPVADWRIVLDVMRRHPSQFSDEVLAAAAKAPERLRTMSLRMLEARRTAEGAGQQE